MKVRNYLKTIRFICKMAVSVITAFMNRDDFLDFNIKYLMLAGLWHDKTWSKTKLKLYKMYEVTMHFLTICFLIQTGIPMKEHVKESVPVLLANFDKTLVPYNFLLKSMFFISNRARLRAIIDEIIHSGDHISEDRKKLMKTHVVVVTFVGLSVLGSFSLLAQYNFEMTVEAWMPFDAMESRMNLLLAAQILAITFVPAMLRGFAMQGIICSIIMYLCDQLMDLQRRLKALNHNQDNFRQEFKEIVKKHIRLMGYSKSMDSIFREFFLIQNLAVTVELCLNAVMITVVKEKTLIISFLAFLVVALINAYIFCYLGNELIIQSQNIAMSAYETSWISWPVDMQKDLLILIRLAQKPFQLSAGGMAMMCIQTFSQALYNGYSLFAVLNDALD